MAKYAYGHSRYSLPHRSQPLLRAPLARSLRNMGMSWFSGCRAIRSGSLRVGGRSAARRPHSRYATAVCGSTVPCFPCAARWKRKVEQEDGSEVTAARFLETLPNESQASDLRLDNRGSLDDTRVFVVPASGASSPVGDNPRRLPRQPASRNRPRESVSSRSRTSSGAPMWCWGRGIFRSCGGPSQWASALRPSRFLSAHSLTRQPKKGRKFQRGAGA